jgi:membrane protease subunit (stomatin/prohibitin family)
MGILDKKGSVIGSTTIDWEDAEKRNNVMWKVPRNIRFNDNIVVREDEIAVFYRDGKALDYIDRPDRYALTSINAPIVGGIVKWLSGVQQQAEVYYLQKKVFDGKFGSKQPYIFEDKTFQLVKLSLFGEFRYKVANPSNFINYFVGTLSISTAAEVEDRIKDQVVTSMYNVLGKLKDKGLSVVNLAANLKNIEQIFLEDSKPDFEPYGIAIDKISGLYINLPEEVQKAVDTRASMSILGTNYMGYQTGQAMREAAVNPSGGAAGAGVGVGAGIGMGYTMMGQMGAGVQQQPPAAPTVAAAPPSPPPAGTPCVKCGANVPQGSKFCPSCGASQQATCPNCGASVPQGAKFCPACGKPMQAGACQKCGAKLETGAKFCPECGNPVG